jgi:hypothetical protein
MTSLTQVSILSRKIIRYATYTIILVVIDYYSTRLAPKFTENMFRRLLHHRHWFSELPKIPFPLPENEIPKDLVFTLETATGKLPKLPKQAAIYFMPPSISTIKALDSAKQKAASLGFNPEGSENVPTVYDFRSITAPVSLNLNIVTGVFRYLSI